MNAIIKLCSTVFDYFSDRSFNRDSRLFNFCESVYIYDGRGNQRPSIGCWRSLSQPVWQCIYIALLLHGLFYFLLQCFENVKKAFADIDQLIENGLFSQLRQDFLSCDDISSHYDMVTFVGNLGGIIMGIAQYNNQIQFRNISTFCKYMTEQSQKPYQNLMTYNKVL